MCGIVGLFNKKMVSEKLLIGMRDKLIHRGPDDAGIWINRDNRVGLAHRRLSIIDLSLAGRQPMSDLEGNVQLTFNGEIYNFKLLRKELEELGWRFKTGTDSEVIIHSFRQWGEDCVQKFNGMFAFGLYDVINNRFFLARDRLGKKPLYYIHAAQRFAFASEAKVLLLAQDRSWQLDPNAMNFYFTYGYIPGDMSIFQGIKKLLPGHCLSYDANSGELRSWAYWRPTPITHNDTMDIEELADNLEHLLEDSVRLRMISDVPLGVLLSGGLDSSMITAMAARISSQPVQTFTIAFPGGKTFDEGPYARLVARHFGTEHHELALTKDCGDIIGNVARHLDEPLADPSVLPTFLVSQLTRKHVTVALGGDGGDELFGGYAWYRGGLDAERLMHVVPRLLRQMAGAVANYLPVGFRGRNYILSISGDMCHHRIVCSSIFSEDMRRRLYTPLFFFEMENYLTVPETYMSKLWNHGGDTVQQMTLLDLLTFLPDDILFKVDRASMAYSLEIRAPWLDYRIVDFAMSRIPSKYKVNEADSRLLQKTLARRILPANLELNRKQGFVMPLHEWMAGKLGDIAVQAIAESDYARCFDLGFAAELLRGQRKGYSNGGRLFALLMFGLWLDGLRDG